MRTNFRQVWREVTASWNEFHEAVIQMEAETVEGPPEKEVFWPWVKSWLGWLWRKVYCPEGYRWIPKQDARGRFIKGEYRLHWIAPKARKEGKHVQTRTEQRSSPVVEDQHEGQAPDKDGRRENGKVRRSRVRKNRPVRTAGDGVRSALHKQGRGRDAILGDHKEGKRARGKAPIRISEGVRLKKPKSTAPKAQKRGAA